MRRDASLASGFVADLDQPSEPTEIFNAVRNEAGDAVKQHLLHLRTNKFHHNQKESVSMANNNSNESQPGWWNKVKRATEVASAAASDPLLRMILKFIDESTDNAKWHAQRWISLERIKNSLKEWSHAERALLDSQSAEYEDVVLSIAAFLRLSLRPDDVKLRPGKNRHKPDILVAHTVAIRILLNPQINSIESTTNEISAMAKSFPALLVIINANNDAKLELHSNLDGKANVDLIDLPGKIALVHPPRWEDLRIFISHHDNDAKWVNRLKVHLNPLRKEKKFLLWDPSNIMPGEDKIKSRIMARTSAQVYIIMLSADYLDQESEEQKSILDRAELSLDDIKIILLYVGYCTPDVFPRLLRYRSINAPEQPLNAVKAHDADRILSRVGASLEQLLTAGTNVSRR